MNKKKVMIILPLAVLVIGGGAYKFGPLKPKVKPVKMKVEGSIVPMATGFVINLAGGHFGKISVSLVLTKAPKAAIQGASVVLPEDSVIRAIITDQLTGLPVSDLIERPARERVTARLLKLLKQRTDEPITQVLLTDIAVE